MSLDQISDLNAPLFRSDSYAAAFRAATEAMDARYPLTLATLAHMDQLAGNLPAHFTDSTENLQDDRKICRQAVIDASRATLKSEIDKVMLELDHVRQRAAHGEYPVDAVLLNEASCAALNAMVSLMHEPFNITMRHLDTARAILTNLLTPGRLAAAV